MSKVKSKEFIDSTDGSSDSDSDVEMKKEKLKKKTEKRKSEDTSEKAAKKQKTEEKSPKKEAPTEKETGKKKETPKKKEKAPKKESSAIEGNAKDGFELGRLRKISVSEFKGRKFVNIREYYTDDAGDLKPGKRGIALQYDQWHNLLDVKDEVNNAVAGGGSSWELGKNKVVRLNLFKGKTLYDIREMYDADGEMKPGKKGISLSREQWDKVFDCAHELSSEL